MTLRRNTYLGVALIVLVTSCSKNTWLTDEDLCTAVVSIRMGTDPLIMRASKNNDIVTISYNRKSDGKLWKYKCKRQENQIIWGMNRFNTHKLDEKYTFIVNPQELIITETYPGGTENIYKFPIESPN